MVAEFTGVDELNADELTILDLQENARLQNEDKLRMNAQIQANRAKAVSRRTFLFDEAATCALRVAAAASNELAKIMYLKFLF